jgi:serine/threonine protein kinase
MLVAAVSYLGIAQILDKATIGVHAFTTIDINGLSRTYAAPEVISRFHKSARFAPPTAEQIKARDVYAFGITIFEMLKRNDAYRPNRKR